MFTLSGIKDVGIIKFEFVAKTQLLRKILDLKVSQMDAFDTISKISDLKISIHG